MLLSPSRCEHSSFKCNDFKDRGRALFNMWQTLERRAQFAITSRIENGNVKMWLSPWGRAHPS
eukprot:4840939-Pyramimonas_sp.AAC.1